MKSSTRLDSAVFQLTPTRTRCDLLISANGKMEKIASGLLNPFLAHLKTAQEQMAKGGYSIILEPEPGSDATWFTKGTVERFVRFVSTPEVLERVYTVETEILQMEEAIAIQSNNDIGLSAVEDHQTKPVESIEGSKPLLDPSEEKAIVLYKPGSHPPGVNGSTVQEGDSKVQLLKVLETRKTVLQKEQGMAFARAAAAGFDIDHMAPLMSFSESFGATRLMDACVRFMDLWKRKHETGQWLEIEAAEARSDFSAMNASGIVLANVVNKQNGSREVCPDTPENNGKASIHTSIDEKASTDHQPTGNPEYFQGQFPHPMFPHWPVHSPPGSLPVFQGYPVQGMPYYPGSPFFSPPYQAVEDRRLSAGQRMGHKRHSMDSKDAESESWEMEKARSGDDVEVGKETSHSQEQRKKSSRSGRKQSGMVVIRNLNYITSKKQNSSNSDSQSTSGSGTDEEDENLTGSSPKIQYKNSLRSSKGKEGHAKSIDTLNSFDKEGTADGTDADGAQWQVFQNFLLRDADEEEHASNQGMFAMEKEVRGQRRQHAVYDDPLAYGKNVSQQEENMTDTQKFSGNTTRLLKGSNDESLISRKIGQSSDGRMFMDGQLDVHSAERDGRRIMYRRSANDAFMIHKRENQADFTNSSDPLAVNGFESASNGLDKRSSNNIDDDSYIVSLRSVSLDEVGVIGRNAIDMDSEFPSSQQKAENISSRVGGQFNYEANDLSLMPERGTENKPTGYDPALDYEMQAHAGDGASLDKRNKEVVSDIKQGSKKSEKDRKSKLTSDASDKKKILGPTRKGRPSKLSALDEAKARAERLRNFKADIQKMKKEKEEEDRRRLEALKIARQKRIAARGNSVNAQSPLSSQQTKKQLPTKLSPSFHKGSKFSDSEPGSSSPLQRFPMRTASLGSTDSHKPSKSSKSNTGSHSTGNRLSRSVSALPEPKKERSRMSDTKASMSRIRRLSEPKITSGAVSSVRARSNELSSKPKISYESQSKKLSAIVNYDKGKAASLPELKIRTSQGPSGKSAAKEMMLKVNENEASTAEFELNRNKDKKSHQSEGDDSTVIEKTVVMLECEKPSIPAPQTSDESMGLEKGHCDNHATGAKSGIVSDYSNIHPPIPPKGVDRETSEPNLQGQLNAHDTGLVKVELVSNMVKASPRFSSQTEKPYQAPYARLSSLEDPCTGNSEYVKAPPASIQTNTVEQETVKALISDSKSLKLEKTPEALDKRQIKESSKGLRKLLKFGRKTHSSGTNEHSVESDNVSINGTEADELVGNAAASSEVHTLKNLISQDETPAATPQKTSRHFSLLSPFRSKSSEKKLPS